MPCRDAAAESSFIPHGRGGLSNVTPTKMHSRAELLEAGLATAATSAEHNLKTQQILRNPKTPKRNSSFNSPRGRKTKSSAGHRDN